jgi:hypothetical protein
MPRAFRHKITFAVDSIRQQPVIRHERREGPAKSGTHVTVHWPSSSSSILESASDRFLQIADDYTWLNPHLTLTLEWFGRSTSVEATNSSWPKWRPSDPTSAHWYEPKHLQRLIAGYDEDAARDRTVREFVAEFRGLSGTAKQKKVLEATGLGRASLSALRNGDGLDVGLIETLLAAMRSNSAPVKPEQLGAIGKDHLQRRFLAAGCEMDSLPVQARCRLHRWHSLGHRNSIWLVSRGLSASPGDRRQLVARHRQPVSRAGPLWSQPRHHPEPTARRRGRARDLGPAHGLPAG